MQGRQWREWLSHLDSQTLRLPLGRLSPGQLRGVGPAPWLKAWAQAHCRLHPGSSGSPCAAQLSGHWTEGPGRVECPGLRAARRDCLQPAAASVTPPPGEARTLMPDAWSRHPPSQQLTFSPSISVASLARLQGTGEPLPTALVGGLSEWAKPSIVHMKKGGPPRGKPGLRTSRSLTRP